MNDQQGDVYLQQTPDGGDFNVDNGVVEMSPGLEVSAYIALFGGNLDDDVVGDNKKQYWGNYIEPDQTEHLRSRTQNVLNTLPITANNLQKLKNAIELDLAYLLTEGIANSISVSVGIPGLNKVRVEVDISAEGEETSFSFTENWKASA